MSDVDLCTLAGLDAATHLYRQVGFAFVEERRGDTWWRTLREQRYELRLDQATSIPSADVGG